MKWTSCLLALLLITISGCSEPATDKDDAPGKAKETVASETFTSGAVTSETVTSESVRAVDEQANFDLEAAKRDYQQTAIRVLDISERTLDGRNALAVMLSVPLNPAEDHQGYFNVSQQGGGVVDGAWLLSPSGKTAWFPYTDPNAEYEVTVYAGLKGVNNQTLTTSASATIKTRDMQASVNFDTRGSFLTEGLGNGLPVVTVNVEQVNIDFFRLKDDQVHAFLNRIDDYSNYYWNIQNLTNYAELVHSGRYDLNAPSNTRVKRTIDTRSTDALQQPGLYLAVMLPAGEYQKKQLVWFSVTDLGLHARQYEQQLDVHVSSLKTGKPLPDVKVSLLDAKSVILSESKTSPDGLASFKSAVNKARLIVAQAGSHYSVIETRKPALDLSEFDLGQRPQLPMELFVYSPRDLFRPGELVDFSGLLRDGDGREVQATILNAQIKRPDGSVAKTFKWQPQELAYYHYAWLIPNDAPVGNWELVVTGALKKPVIYPFKVEEFLPERMKLTFNPIDDQTQVKRIVTAPADKVTVPVLGEYLYGAPAAGNRLSTIVNVRHWRNPIKALENYQFGQANEAGINRKIDLDDLHLNNDGKGEIAVDSHWQQARSPLKIKFISSLYESGGRPVTRVYSTLVWPADALIGIRSSFGDDNPEANSRVTFDIVKATLDGTLKQASNLDVQLVREDRQYFWVYSDSQGWHYQWSDKEYAEVTQTVNIAAGDATRLELPVSYGNYRLEVRDPENQLMSSVRFYAGYNWYANWKDTQSGAQAARPDKVTVALDKEHYQAGDVANVTIVPPEAGEALIMVEGDGPLWMQRLSIAEGGATVQIPIDSGWQQHNLYVTAMVLRQGDHKQAITPKRSFGLAHLALDRTDRQLQIGFDIPEKVLPQQRLDVKLTVHPASDSHAEHSSMDVTGEPSTTPSGQQTAKQIYLTLAAVDVGVLSISNFDTPNPHQGFFGQRRYSVENRDIYNQVIEVSNAEKARLRFGGDADVARGGKEPQSEVQIVSLFSGPVEVKGGSAIVPIDLPDFNGRLRLMALAYSADAYGHGEQELTVAAPVVTQMAMPRFLALGDKSTLSLDINNLSGATQTLEVILESQGPVAVDAKPTRITLANQQKQTLNFAIEATGYSGQAQFDMKLSGDNIDTLTRHWRLGVRPAYPALIQQKSALLKQNEQFSLDDQDIAGMLPDSIEALVSVSSRANLNLQQQLKNLLAYPYGCLEQTSSRAFPLTYATPENRQRFGLKTIDEKERINMIERGIDRIASMQLKNGGFGLWSNRSPEEHWLTVFVADFLLSAREMGVEVPAQLIDTTMKRLKQYLNRGGNFVGERWSQDSNHYAFSYKAYSAYVLSRVKQAPLGSMRTLFDNKLKWAKSGLPQAQLGIALIRMGDKKRGMQAIDHALNNIPENRRYLGDYGSNIRDLAMIIHLLIENDIYKDRAFAMSFELAEKIQSRRWLSTQERNALFLAGLSLEASLTDSWQAEVILGAAEESLKQQAAYRKSVDGYTIGQGVSIESQHDQPLFVTATISGHGLHKPAASSEGLTITRTWYTPEGHAVAADDVKVGQLYVAHLELTAEERTPDALVVDLLPAGFELENQNLEHAIKLDEFRIDGKTFEELTRRTRIKHQEYRDDRYVAALDLNQHSSANLFYLIRAVTPGTYQVPPPLVEDMYRPEKRGIGDTFDSITVKNATF
ncbi:MAG: alpha-2-macroglobulin [Motiliproteus sp.]